MLVEEVLPEEEEGCFEKFAVVGRFDVGYGALGLFRLVWIHACVG